MANLKEVRNRIASVKSIQQITKAMKMVSAAKFKRATNSIIALRPYANKLQDILTNLTASLDSSDISSPFVENRESNRILIIAITSNKGLAGAFNTNVMKGVNRLLNEQYSKQRNSGNVTILTVGKKAYDFYTRRNFNVLADNNDIFSNLSFAATSKIAEIALNGFVRGDYDRVELVYNQFKNAAVQVVVNEQMLPLIPNRPSENGARNISIDYILEPNKEEIVTDLIPQMLKLQLHKAILDSHASEHGARMTSMDKATENAGELLKSLQLSYNQARQAAITTELTEIVSGAAALGS